MSTKRSEDATFAFIVAGVIGSLMSCSGTAFIAHGTGFVVVQDPWYVMWGILLISPVIGFIASLVGLTLFDFIEKHHLDAAYRNGLADIKEKKREVGE